MHLALGEHTDDRTSDQLRRLADRIGCELARLNTVVSEHTTEGAKDIVQIVEVDNHGDRARFQAVAQNPSPNRYLAGLVKSLACLQRGGIPR